MLTSSLPPLKRRHKIVTPSHHKRLLLSHCYVTPNKVVKFNKNTHSHTNTAGIQIRELQVFDRPVGRSLRHTNIHSQKEIKTMRSDDTRHTCSERTYSFSLYLKLYTLTLHLVFLSSLNCRFLVLLHRLCVILCAKGRKTVVTFKN